MSRIGWSFAERVGNAVAKRARAAQDRARTGGATPRLGDVLRDGYANGWADVPATFVASTGRVGSKTLTALWDLDPVIASHHEPLPRLIKVSGAAWQRPEDPAWVEVVHGARDDLVADAHRRGQVYAESNNRLTALAPALAEAFTGARFVLLWRDPEPFVVSALRRGYYVGHHWDFARYRPRPDDPAAEAFERWSPGLRAAWLWAATNRFALDRAVALPERWAVVASDDLFAGRDRALHAVFAAAGRPVPDRRAVDAVLSSKINAQHTGEATDVPFEGPDAATYHELIDPVLAALRSASDGTLA